MGALTSLTMWIPEDDLLLRKAVEDGASLESLAKGAVCFSRRFTLRELQERWHSLLYDMETSSEASARMIEIEIELSVTNPPKASRNYDYKGKEYSFGKRKLNSVRSHYYAMRKRICTKPCGSGDLGFFVSPSSRVDTGSDCCCGDQLKLQNEYPSSTFAVGAPISDHYGHPESVYDSGQHAFPELLRADSAAVVGNISHHVHHTGHAGSVKDEHPDGIVGNDCLYGYTENLSPMSLDKAGGNNAEQSFDHDYVVKDFQEIPGENLISLKACSDAQEIRQPQKFPTTNLYESDNIEAKPFCGFDSTDDNHESLCSGFVGNHNLSSQAPECSDSFHQLGYSSGQPGLPMWRTIEDIATPIMPMHDFEDKDEGVLIIDDIKKMDSTGGDGATSEPKLNDGMCSAGLSNSTIMSEADFVDFSSPYIDFADDEELLFIDMDENDIADGSCLNGLSSILMSSPSDTHQDNVPDSSDPRATEVLDSCLVIPDGACSGQSYTICDQIHSVHHKVPSVCASEINVPPTSLETSRTAEHLGGFISCTLNTEVLEVPCNDHVFLPTQVLPPFPSSDLEQSYMENSIQVSPAVKVLSNDRKAFVRDSTMIIDEQAATAPTLVPSNAGSSVLSKVGLMHSSGGCRVKAEPFGSDSVDGNSRHAGIAIYDPHSRTSATVGLQPLVTTLKEDSTLLDPGKHVNFDTSSGSFLEKPVYGSDNAKLYSLNIADGCRQEAAMQDTMQMHVPSRAELISADMTPSDPVTNVSISDQEERFSDSENEIPNFSDIETMILDMDLGPYDKESSLFTKEVSKYQHVDSKKAIIRLEQGAHSYMSRAISSHGAFAIFYGRRLKYFIKDPEVSLGRATEEVEVDIDLGREGRANKISRLQAIIKLDEDGTFVMRNVGKCSIFVNGKELLSKKRMNLSSGSLIEIKDMRFIFQINQSAVRRYIMTPRDSSQEQSTRFDWAPGSNP